MVAELRASHRQGETFYSETISAISTTTIPPWNSLSCRRAGKNYQQILASLTTNPARSFRFIESASSRKESSRPVVLSADPAQDITAFSKVRYTIRNGNLTYQEK